MNISVAGGQIQVAVEKVTQNIAQQITSRGMRASVKLRNSALHVLANPSPSSPGNPPGVRTGNLRANWSMAVGSGEGGGLVSVTPTIISNANYSGYLENGTYKMAARPFKDKIIESALPEITALYNEPYV